MGGTYKQVRDYLLPDIPVAPQTEKFIGVWGMRHHNHLRKTNKVLFSRLVISGKMNDYLADIDKQAEEMFSRLRFSSAINSAKIMIFYILAEFSIDLLQKI